MRFSHSFLGVFFFYPHSLILFLSIEAAKGLRMEKKKTGTLLNSISILGVYNYFVVEMFYWTRRNNMLPSQSVKSISVIIFGKLWIIDIEYTGSF